MFYFFNFLFIKVAFNLFIIFLFSTMAAIGHHAGIDKCLTKKHNKKAVGFIKKFFIGLLRVGGLLVDKFVSPTNQLYQV